MVTEIVEDARVTHGMSDHPLYPTWKNMMQRCYNERAPNYADYGGRGIRVCDWWHDPHNFIEDMGERPVSHTLDRKDNYGDYCPENCRWATWKEQLYNRSNNLKKVTAFGTTLTLREWSDKLSIPYAALNNRINRLGWSVSRALTTPVRNKKEKSPTSI